MEHRATRRSAALRIAALSGVLLAGAVAVFAAPALAAEGGTAAASSRWLLFVFYVINFAIFCAIVWYADRYFGGFTAGFFRNRNRTIRQTIARADSAFKEAEEMARAAADRLQRLEAEKGELVKSIREETAFAVARIGELARESAERLRRDGIASAAALGEASRRRTRERMAAAAVAHARDVIARDFERADQERLLDGFIRKLRYEDAQ